jgi:Uncharacterized protein conserved in bacteria (DUF2188)
MPEGDVETYHSNGKWRNRIEGHADLPGEHATRQAAVDAGRAEAEQRHVEHIVRRLDGTIGERGSHGWDPRDIRG